VIGGKLDLGENAGEIDARAIFRREDIHLEPERAEPRLNAEMARGEPAIARALERPLGLLRRHHEGGMADALKFLGEPARDLVHFP
jgi:hypothetical protein